MASADRSVWCVVVHGLHEHCWECDGGGDCDIYFVGAESRREAIELVYAKRTNNGDHETWFLDAERYPYKAFAIRPWRGRASRFLSEREVEL